MLDVTPNRLDIPQPWLLSMLQATTKPTQSPVATAGTIPNGLRNVSLASYLGFLRRQGFGLAELIQFGRDYNKHCNPPQDDQVVVRTAESIARYAPEAAPRWLDEPRQPPQVYSLAEFVAEYPDPSPVVVNQVCRAGEVANFIAAPKVGKSWATYGLDFCVATGRPWLGQFATTQSAVMHIDTELQPTTLADRFKVVAQAMSQPIASPISLMALRGDRRNVAELAAHIGQLADKGDDKSYGLIVIDTKYMLERSGEENSNDDETALYLEFQRLAESASAAVVVVHHSSKGNQAGKAITDIGSGGGAQSRAADSHIVIRPHALDGFAVLESKVRLFPPMNAVGLQFVYPLWQPVADLDTSQLAGIDGPKGDNQAKKDQANRDKIERFLFDRGPNRMADIAAAIGDSREVTQRIVGKMVADGQIHKRRVGANGWEYFSELNPPQPEV